jgi:hypothetical protein
MAATTDPPDTFDAVRDHAIRTTLTESTSNSAPYDAAREELPLNRG